MLTVEAVGLYTRKLRIVNYTGKISKLQSNTEIAYSWINLFRVKILNCLTWAFIYLSWLYVTAKRNSRSSFWNKFQFCERSRSNSFSVFNLFTFNNNTVTTMAQVLALVIFENMIAWLWTLFTNAWVFVEIQLVLHRNSGLVWRTLL